ncbi:chromosome segregation ATPase [Pseudarthrobacter oxydans]|uniref:Chromosome segregation ATPase n=1 Tax=Pseudarthrobacter oxydans TaxID=1671 RepID=A0AAW8NFX0_PSEOX|nr:MULTISPECIES: DNA-binding protein [Micrococcaceae]MDR7166242.1 chromosome segregation ATPase [Pseudarthrobacter oxydans]TNB75613.1 KfrA protein [Arthrobacter sp. BB-1]
MTTSVKDRVFAAAEQISAERRPTVSTVRAAAGVSNADATRYLKEWNEEKLAAGGQVAATPPALLEQATRLAAAVWAEASSQAAERHTAVETAWVQERKDKDQEIAELVADLDKAAAEKESAAAEFQARIIALESGVKALEQRLAALGSELEEARAAERAAAGAAAEAEKKLASAEARSTTLEKVHNALLQRVAPETKASGA